MSRDGSDMTDALLASVGPHLKPSAYKVRMGTIGIELAKRYLETKAPSAEAFHVVTAVEDFEGLATGIMKGLRKKTANVSYSCIWPRPRILSENPQIETCAIDQSFHQERPDMPFEVIFASANVGSVTALKSMMLHTIADREFDGGGDFQVLTPIAHQSAAQDLHDVSPERWRGRIRWTVIRTDYKKSPSGYSIPGLRGNPNNLAGLRNPFVREQYIPPQVRKDFNFPLDPGPDPEPSPDRANDGGGGPGLGRFR